VFGIRKISKEINKKERDEWKYAGNKVKNCTLFCIQPNNHQG